MGRAQSGGGSGQELLIFLLSIATAVAITLSSEPFRLQAVQQRWQELGTVAVVEL